MAECHGILAGSGVRKIEVDRDKTLADRPMNTRVPLPPSPIKV